jgi:hypothetical protein
MSTFGSKAPKSREPTYGDLRAIEDLNARATDLINLLYAACPKAAKAAEAQIKQTVQEAIQGRLSE